MLAIYDIDNVDASALPHLADQFNVLGLRGWNLANTEVERRSLVKEAIILHKTAGTPYAIRRVMALVGYPNATVVENPPLRYDGSSRYDGEEYYSGIKWFAFYVTLDPEQSQVSGDLINLILALINEWKNARSRLIDLRIGNISLFQNLLQYDGLSYYDGTQTYDGIRNV